MYLLSFLLGIACLWDYSTGKIPNFLQFHILSTGLIYSFYGYGLRGAAAFLAKVVITAGVLFLPYLLSMIGAGDVKMIALAAGFLKRPQIMLFIFFTLLAAVPPALIKILADKGMKKRFAHFFEYIEDCIKTKKVKSYHRSRDEQLKTGIAMSGPVLFSILLAIGGVY